MAGRTMATVSRENSAVKECQSEADGQKSGDLSMFLFRAEGAIDGERD